MTKDEAVKHFGTQEKLAHVLGITQQTVAGWVGDFPPEIHQVRLERLTDGDLKAEPECYLPKSKSDAAISERV